MVDVPIWARYGGSGLIFLATACGSGATSAPIPTSTPELSGTKSASTPPPIKDRLILTPEPHVIASSTRGCNLAEIDLLQEVLGKYLQPQFRGIYDQDFFTTLSRSNDLNVKDFVANHRVNNGMAYFWDLRPYPQSGLIVSLAEPMCRQQDKYRATLTYSLTASLFPETLTEGEDTEKTVKFIRPDKLAKCSWGNFCFTKRYEVGRD